MQYPFKIALSFICCVLSFGTNGKALCPCSWKVLVYFVTLSIVCRWGFSSFYRYCGSWFYLKQNKTKQRNDFFLKGIYRVACLSWGNTTGLKKISPFITEQHVFTDQLNFKEIRWTKKKAGRILCKKGNL